MEPIRFEKPNVGLTYVVNLDQVLWVEFLSGPDIKMITFHFTGEKSLSVTEGEVGKEKFETLKTETKIEDSKGGVGTLDRPVNLD